jgi:hypothetical protein
VERIRGRAFRVNIGIVRDTFIFFKNERAANAAVMHFGCEPEIVDEVDIDWCLFDTFEEFLAQRETSRVEEILTQLNADEQRALAEHFLKQRGTTHERQETSSEG